VSVKVSNVSPVLRGRFTNIYLQHFLRAEPGIYYEDLYPLVSFLPRHSMQPAMEPTAHDALPMWNDHETLSQKARSFAASTPSSTISSKSSKRRKDYFDPEKALPQVDSEVPLRAARNPPKATVYDYIPFLLLFKPIISGPHRLYRLIFKKREDFLLDGPAPAPAGTRGLMGKKHAPPALDSNVPLEITLFLSSYTQWLLAKGLLQPSIASVVVSNVASLQDAVTNLERVRNTPIPFAYQVCLRGMSVWSWLMFN
jgi:putative membrane protein